MDRTRQSGNRPSAPVGEQFVEPVDETSVVPRSRRLADDEMDITPMIDMTFLLLIFFTVAGRQDDDSHVRLPPARHGAAVVIAESVVFTITAPDTDHSITYLGDGVAPERQVAVEDLDRASEQVTHYIDDQLAADPKKKYVLIKADQHVRHRDVARLTNLVAKSNKDLYVAVAEQP